MAINLAPGRRFSKRLLDRKSADQRSPVGRHERTSKKLSIKLNAEEKKMAIDHGGG